MSAVPDVSTGFAPAAAAGGGAKSQRLLSLDVFRGMTIAAMLLVNNAGDWGHIFTPLGHVKWHGCTATDLIFPFFLFIMGVAMTFSFSRRLAEHGHGRAAIGPLWPQIFKRTFLLFAFGMVLNTYAWLAAPWIENLRIPGVLQRIALCYFAVSILALTVSPRAQLAWAVGLLAGYWAAMKFIPITGYPPGTLDFPGNVASFVDWKILGRRAYEFHKESGWYHDPEGLLSTLPAIATTLSGLMAGYWLRREDTGKHEKAAGLAAAGLGIYAIGALWQYEFPYNKNLWTSSYVLHTSGWACMVLGACYWAIDVRGWKRWCQPFVDYGTNAITAYMLAGLLAYTTIAIRVPRPGGGDPMFLKSWIYANLYKSWIEPVFGPYVCSAAYGMTYVIVCWAAMHLLWRKKIFLKV